MGEYSLVIVNPSRALTHSVVTSVGDGVLRAATAAETINRSGGTPILKRRGLAYCQRLYSPAWLSLSSSLCP